MSRDKRARQRFILRTGWFMVPAPLIALAVAHALMPPPPQGLDEPIGRLALATRWLVVASLPYIAVCLTIALTRFFEGAHDPTRASESERLKIHCRAMQNTLEQLVWFSISLLALAPMVSPTQARLAPIACVVFALARVLYWWGYSREGTLGRAPGVQATFSLNVQLTLAALGLLGRTLF
jgi:uncharacterized membrane protein YecN with MAPEG domain